MIISTHEMSLMKSQRVVKNQMLCRWTWIIFNLFKGHNSCLDFHSYIFRLKIFIFYESSELRLRSYCEGTFLNKKNINLSVPFLFVPHTHSHTLITTGKQHCFVSCLNSASNGQQEDVQEVKGYERKEELVKGKSRFCVCWVVMW